MDKICGCGKTFYVKPYLIERKKHCSKVCFYKYRAERPTGLKYVLVKENPTSFKKGHIPWHKGRKGEGMPKWKGDDVGYWGIHSWIERELGTPRICDFCGILDSKIYQWSNKSGEYKRDLSDWQRLCVKCHVKYDYEKFGARSKGFFKK